MADTEFPDLPPLPDGENVDDLIRIITWRSNYALVKARCEWHRTHILAHGSEALYMLQSELNDITDPEVFRWYAFAALTELEWEDPREE